MRREDEVQKPPIDLNQFGSQNDLKLSIAPPEHDDERKHRHFKEKFLLVTGVSLIGVVLLASVLVMFFVSDPELRKRGQEVGVPILTALMGYLVGKKSDG